MAEVRRMRPLLGTFIEIRIEGDDTVASMAVSRAFAAIEQVHQLLSFHDQDSDLTRLNQQPQQWHALHPLSLRVLRAARALGAATDNLFNCTVGGSLVRANVLPDHGGDCIASGNHTDIELDAGRARLRRPVKVTLDGIAKGYAVDRAVLTLKRAGVGSGLINAGGDLRIFGHQAQPLCQRLFDGSLRSLGQARNLAIATSCFDSSDARRFPAHLIGDLHGDARVSWSVCAQHAWRADALTKVAALTPAPLRQQVLRKLGGRLLDSTLQACA